MYIIANASTAFMTQMAFEHESHNLSQLDMRDHLSQMRVAATCK